MLTKIIVIFILIVLPQQVIAARIQNSTNNTINTKLSANDNKGPANDILTTGPGISSSEQNLAKLDEVFKPNPTLGLSSDDEYLELMLSILNYNINILQNNQNTLYNFILNLRNESQQNQANSATLIKQIEQKLNDNIIQLNKILEDNTKNTDKKIQSIDELVKRNMLYNSKLDSNITLLSNELSLLNNDFFEQIQLLQDEQFSIQDIISAINKRLSTFTTKDEHQRLLQEKIDSNVQPLSQSLQLMSRIILIVSCIILSSMFILFLINRRKVLSYKSYFTDIQEKIDALNSEVITKFSESIDHLQDLSKNLFQVTTQDTSKIEDQHSIIKDIAEKITFMEVAMRRMDPTVRGFKQLSRSIAQIKDKFKTKGYEIVDMLGKPYHEGMKVIANFMDDEDLEEGQRIITGVVKPQINYNGVMIQSAQITVSQNIG